MATKRKKIWHRAVRSLSHRDCLPARRHFIYSFRWLQWLLFMNCIAFEMKSRAHSQWEANWLNEWMKMGKTQKWSNDWHRERDRDDRINNIHVKNAQKWRTSKTADAQKNRWKTTLNVYTLNSLFNFNFVCFRFARARAKYCAQSATFPTVDEFSERSSSRADGHLTLEFPFMTLCFLLFLSSFDIRHSPAGWHWTLFASEWNSFRSLH